MRAFHPSRHPLLPVLLCALLWGSAFPVIKQVYQHWGDRGIESSLAMIYLFAGLRFSLAGSGLLMVGKDLRSELRKTSYRVLAGFALTQTFIQYICFYQAVSVSSASLTSLLAGTGSFWWMLLAPVMLRAPWPSLAQWLGLVIGGIGVVLAVYAPGAGTGRPVLGACLMLTATFSGAIAILLFQRIKDTISSINATGLSLFSGGLGLLMLGSRELHRMGELFDLRVALSTVWLAFVSAAAFSLWNYLSTQYSVALLASYRFLIPICGILESLIFLKTERLGWGLAIGAILVITSVIFAQRNAPKAPLRDVAK